MIELIVAFSLSLCSLALAALSWRWLATRKECGHEVQRLLGAVKRAGAEFLWQESRLLGISLVVVLAVLLCPILFWRSSGAAPAQLAWSALGLCLGAAVAGFVAYMSLGIAIGVTSRVVEAVRTGSGDALASTLRGCALIAVLTDAASLLLTLGIVAIPAWYLGFAAQANTSSWLSASVRLLPAAALGAVAAAAIFQLGGANFHTAAGVASLAARQQDPSLSTDKDKNPALVAELVGSYVGAVAARVTDYFAALVLANSAMLLVSLWVYAQNAGDGSYALIALPLLVRAVGSVSSALALSCVRFEPGAAPWRSFAGAGLSAALVACVGLFGASLWLLGEGVYLRFFAAGAVGVLANLLVATLTYYRLLRSVAAGGFSAPSTARLDAGAARALGQGLQQTWSLILGIGVCILGAWLLGAGSPLAGGGALALVAVLAGLLSASVFGLVQSLFCRLSEAVQAIAELGRSQVDGRGRARAEELDQLGLELGSLGRTQGILASAGAAALSAFSLPMVTQASSAPRTGADAATLAYPVVLWGGALGACMLLFYVGGVLKTSTRTAAAVAEDIVERLSLAEPATASLVRLPSYRVSVQLAAQSATERLLPLTLVTVLAPLALAFTLRAVYGPQGQLVTAQGLMAFSAIATLTGCCAALAAEGAEALLASSRRRSLREPRLVAAGPAAEFIGRSVGPAALLGVKATVVAALVSGPLLFGN